MIGSLVQNRPDPRGGVILQRQDPRLVELLRVSNIEQLEAGMGQLSGVELPEGARGQVRVEGFGFGILARLAGMEQLWGHLLAPAGARVIDVRGEGFDIAVTDFEAPIGYAPAGSAPQGIVILIPLLILGIVAILVGLGMGLFRSLALLVEKVADAALPIAFLVIAVAAAIALVATSTRGRNRSP